MNSTQTTRAIKWQFQYHGPGDIYTPLELYFCGLYITICDPLEMWLPSTLFSISELLLDFDTITFHWPATPRNNSHRIFYFKVTLLRVVIFNKNKTVK